ncbi:DUF4252 domain-containing protein [Marivirga aurantiaca]|nr:DUF4252 domain-containing protein [Marivirga aurantiaca]
MEKIEEEKIHSLSLHLYPSTIRMVNIANDPNFHEVTKNVKKAHYLQINLDSEEKTSAYEAWKNEQSFSDWEEMLSARMNGSLVNIYTPQGEEDYFFASIESNDVVSLVWLEGKVDLAKATQLMQTGIDLGPVTDFLTDKKETEEQREKMKALRKQMNEGEAMPEVDSLEIDQPNK